MGGPNNDFCGRRFEEQHRHRAPSLTSCSKRRWPQGGSSHYIITVIASNDVSAGTGIRLARPTSLDRTTLYATSRGNFGPDFYC